MSYTGEKNSNGIPPFSALPLRKQDPYLSAWGLYGEKDQLGALNRLTDEHGLFSLSFSPVPPFKQLANCFPLFSSSSKNRSGELFVLKIKLMEK